ncbi:hypothetical protein [Halorussus halophilus]|uniref:hypothetical protein n=1 Tax=Halorussus halophilus TaxID=2650975 RepID=UPI001CE4207B|nr:hypothetical protein [Halorussus halophilus]
MVSRIIVGAGALDFAIPVVLTGAFGATRVDRYDGTGGILVGLIWFGLQVFFFDLDGGADLVPAFAFVACGVGLLVDQLSGHTAKGVVTGIALVAVVMFWWHGGFSGFIPGAEPLQSRIEVLFWNQSLPETCHVRRSQMEVEFVQKTGTQLSDSTCDGEAFRRFGHLF